MFWLKCCERKTLFRLKKEAEQTGYGVSRTMVVDGEWAQVDELFLFFLNLGDGQDCKTLRDTVALPSARPKNTQHRTHSIYSVNKL